MQDLAPLPEARFKAFFVMFEFGRSAEDMFAEWRSLTLGRRLSELSRRRHAIAVAAHVTESLVRHMLHADTARHDHGSSRMHKRLALMALALDLPTIAPPTGARTGSIALLTEPAVASVRFHFELPRILAQTASNHLLTLPQILCTREEMADELTHLQALHNLDGCIFLRHTPTEEALRVLRQCSTPAVLIQAEVKEYGAPVIAHIVPDQSGIPDGIAQWARVLKQVRPHAVVPEVVVLAVQDENPEPGATSIRNERKRLVMDALAANGTRPVLQVVKDYSGPSALAVYLRHRAADGFVCLSDSLAVAVKQHLIVAGQPWEGRVLGFDNTQLAQDEGISSFDQSRSETAELALGALMRFFARAKESENVWLAPETLKIKVSLKLRPEPGGLGLELPPKTIQAAPQTRVAHRARERRKRRPSGS